MMSPRSLISLAIILIVTHQQHQGAQSKALNVKYQVKFRRLPPKEFSAALGSSITIECEAGASPPPTIHWLKNGKRIYLNDVETNQLDDVSDGQSTVPVDDVNRIALSATRSRLYIDCAQEQDQATYTCVAENAYSRVSSHTKLNLIMPAVQSAPLPAVGGAENDLPLRELADSVVGPQQRRQQQSGASNIDLTAVPQCLSDQLTNGSPPQAPVRIHMWTHNILEIVKNNVIIYCRSNVNRQSLAAPLADSTKAQQESSEITQTDPTTTTNGRNKAATEWTLPDDKLVSEHMKDKYEVLETGDLLIKNLSWADMGSYVCTVSDERSSDSISAFVYPAAVKVNSKRSVTTNWDLNIR